MRLGFSSGSADSGISSDRNRTGNLVVLCDHRGAYGGFLADTSVSKMDYFAKHMYGAKNLWQVAMVIGIVVGAFASMKMSGARRQTISPVWNRAVGFRSLSSRAPMAFAGGFIMVLGARIADGCTTGHGISGVAQLALGSTVAVTAMFAGAIATALLMKRV